jgi:hypothetical protein
LAERRERLVAMAPAVVALLLSGCGPGGGSGTPSPRSPAASPPGIPGLRSVTPAALPSEPDALTAREATKPDANFDSGFVVQITPSGFHPAWLVATCCTPVVWLNLTNATNSIVFDALGVHSGPIAPGGAFTFSPHNVESIAYHSATYPAMKGIVQVNQPAER